MNKPLFFPRIQSKITEKDNLFSSHTGKRGKLVNIFGDRNLSYSYFNENYLPDTKKYGDLYFFLNQVHSDQILNFCSDLYEKVSLGYPEYFFTGDAVITSLTNVFLCIKTADCYPVFIYDKAGTVTSAIHAGRKGLELDIIFKTIRKITSIYNILPKDLLLKAGPGICIQHYSVDRATYKNFYRKEPELEENFTVLKIDLKKNIIEQAVKAGIPLANIQVANICSFQDNQFFSYRRGDLTERQINLTGILNDGE